MNYKSQLWLLVLVLLGSAPVAAQESLKGRPCVRQDLPGVWQTIAVQETPAGIRSEAFRMSPYEYQLFDNGGRVLLLRPLDPLSRNEALNDFKQKTVLPPDALTSVILGNGTLVISRGGTPEEVLNCVVALGGGGVIRENDMVWSSLPGVSPRLLRIQRRF